ncbi:MAG: MarR family winged helix-turn-helix transcriptional regulator [Streptosporangiales bacterium]
MAGKELGLPFDPIEIAGAHWEDHFGASSAMKVATSIMRAQQLLLTRYDELLRPYSLTFARYEALVLLVFSRRGELPMRVIGERLMVHPTSATNIVDRLTKQGYVTRRPNPADGRGVLAAVTSEGRDAVRQATKELMAIDFGLGPLEEGHRAQVTEALRELRVAAGDFKPGPEH